MSHISLPKLAERTGYSRRHLQRLVAEGLVPGASRKPSGHWQIADNEALERWLTKSAMLQLHRNSFKRHRKDPVRRAAMNYIARLDVYLNDKVRNRKGVVDEDLVYILDQVGQHTYAALRTIQPNFFGDDETTPQG